MDKQNQLRPIAYPNGTSTIVPKMIPTCKISPQNTPAYFLYAVGQTLNAIMNDAST